MKRKLKPFVQQWLFASRCWGCNRALKGKYDFCWLCRREILDALEQSGCLLRYAGAVKGLMACLRGSAPQLGAAWCLGLLRRSGQLERWRAEKFNGLALAPQNSSDSERGLLLLGRLIAQELKVPLHQPFSKIDRRSQHGRELGDRMDAPIFVQLNARLNLGPKILLIDDVLTTGTTLDQCAYLLRKAGVPEVEVFSLARQMVKRFERKQSEAREESEEMNPLLLHLFM